MQKVLVEDEVATLQRRHAMLRATSRDVAAAIRTHDRIKRRSERRPILKLSVLDSLVVRLIARRTNGSLPACLTYVLQRTTCGCAAESAQPRAHRVTHMLEPLVATAAAPCPVLDAPVDALSPRCRRAMDIASMHLADMALAQWVATCNLQQRCAPTAAQLRTKHRILCEEHHCRHIADGAGQSQQRRQRRSLQRWRKRWGFRIGKLRLRDHFADGELLKKAPLAPTFPFFFFAQKH